MIMRIVDSNTAKSGAAAAQAYTGRDVKRRCSEVEAAKYLGQFLRLDAIVAEFLVYPFSYPACMFHRDPHLQAAQVLHEPDPLLI